MTIDFREVRPGEVNAARSLSRRNPDAFGRYAVERLPCYFEIEDLLEDSDCFAGRQVLILGAFDRECLVGSVLVSHELTEVQPENADAIWERVLERYSEHDADVYSTLAGDLLRVRIPPPNDALLINALCVDPEYRGRGVASRLLWEAVDRTPAHKLAKLFVGAALNGRHPKMCEAVGFRVFRRRFSISDRMQFGCWGSVLMKHEATDR